MRYFQYTKADLDLAYEAGYDDGKEAADEVVAELTSQNNRLTNQVEELSTQNQNYRNIIEDARDQAKQLEYDLGNA